MTGHYAGDPDPGPASRSPQADTERGGWRWRSPIRGPWLTSVLGLVLLVGIPVEFVTGLLSYAAYQPRVGGNDPNPAHAGLGFYLFNWLTDPSWLYRLSEGIHVIVGLAMVPVVLAKLWSVLPTLFTWPPARTAARLLERITLVFLVGGVLFEMTSGILDIDYFGIFHFDFYTGHFYGAWIFVAAFVVHVGLRFGRMVSALRSRSLRAELRTGLADTRPEPPDELGLVAATPDPPTISRRGVLGLVAGSSLAVVVLTAGEAIGGSLRRLAVLGTHYRGLGVGPNDFPVNHTAGEAGVTAEAVGGKWRLEVVGTRTVRLSRARLAALPQRTARLPIACTEGWSTSQHWTGVPLAELARRAGVGAADYARLETIDRSGPVALSWSQVQAPDALLALKVNGADLSLDHGFPARVIVPDAPGTVNRKWLASITFVGARREGA